MFEKIKNLWKPEKIPSIEDANKALDELGKLKYNPKIPMGNGYWYTYFNCENLKNKINLYLESVSCKDDFNLSIATEEGRYWDHLEQRDVYLYIKCEWYSGQREITIVNKIKEIEIAHIKSINIENIDLNIRVSCKRHYSNDIILKCAKKYAKCIDKCMPLNMATIKIMEYNGHSIYNMVITELDTIEDIESYVNIEE